jgi:hypothetical protein
MDQFVAVMADPDAPVLYRLFPPAYSAPGDAAHQEEFRRLMQQDLVDRHREDLELVVSTAEATALSEMQLLAWSRAINSVRLALGTYLGVSEDQPSSRSDSWAESTYELLGVLLEETVDALSRHN